MTKEITKAYIIQEIEDRFKMRELEPEVFSFSERVQPIYDIKSHLEETEIVVKTVSITSATNFLFFTVPANERWYLRSYNVIFLAAGAYKVTGLYIRRVPSTEWIYLDMIEAQTVSYAVNLPIVVRLDPGDSLRMLIDDYTSTADLKVNIDVIKEVLR